MFPVKPRKGATQPNVTTRYRKPGSWIAGFHTGTDFGWTRPVEYVRATHLGHVVRVVKGDRSYGNYIVIQHPDGRQSWYCHLSIIRPGLKVGTFVHTGRWLGIMGSTGNASGRHLHYEERAYPFGYHDHRAPVLFSKPAPKRLKGWR